MVYLCEHPSPEQKMELCILQAVFHVFFHFCPQVALCWTGCVSILVMARQKRRRKNCVTECWPRDCCTPSATAAQSSTVTALPQQALV